MHKLNSISLTLASALNWASGCVLSAVIASNLSYLGSGAV